MVLRTKSINTEEAIPITYFLGVVVVFGGLLNNTYTATTAYLGIFIAFVISFIIVPLVAHTPQNNQ